MPYTTYNCDALTGGGTRALDALPVAGLADKDRAFVESGGKTRRFVFDAGATDAEDVANHPYKVRPDDYAAAGVWIEQIPDGDFLDKTGDTMTGALTLAGNPAADLHAVPRQYADAMAAINLLINAQFEIDQEGVTIGTHSADAYFRDQWKAGASGCTASLSGDVLTITAGSAIQPVEDKNIPNGTYTIAWIGTAQVRIDGGTAQNSPHTFAVSSGTHVEIEFTTGTVQKPVLVAGSVAGVFVRPDYGMDLARCHRYYWQGMLIGKGVGYLYAGSVTSIAYVGGANLPVDMRIEPTIGFITTPTYNNCTHGDFSFSTTSAFVHRVAVDGAGWYRAANGVYYANARL